ncbi:hypothetical protein [Maridesulfovibrio bastinii]|uniref:hypothetical protein n=1 Tax=Maridesulfovibrio bastinii TaxID=47157 RepID=UPI000481C486|nr:hypothetical protein [Maridesulfovibrio bastinii]
MNKFLIAFALSVILLLPTISEASSVNLMDGASVSVIGNYHGSTSYITDGLAKTGTQWSHQSVWWSGSDPYILIKLDGTKQIGSIGVQADSDDSYLVEYWNSDSKKWQTAYTVGSTKSSENNWLMGLDLRESPDLNITTDKIRISAISGDENHSISEVQLHAHTPIPFTFLLFGSGLGLLAFFKRRFC